MLTIILSLTGTFEYLILACVMVTQLQYIPTCLAVIVWRKRRPEVNRSYKIPGGYIVPSFALFTCACLLFQMKATVFLATFAGMAASLPLYFYRKKGGAKKGNGPIN